MKFLCDQCKAKYQIPDEKIAGRNLRMKCRKCSHEIIIRGPKSPESISPRASSRSSRRGGSGATSRPAPPRSTAPRSALGADFRRGGALAEAPVPKAAAVEWYVAINDVPVGPIKREEVARKIGMGAVSAASLCWREGLDDWRPVGDVPELATLLEQRRIPAPPPPQKAAAKKPLPAPPPPVASPPVASPKPANVIPIGGRLGASPPTDFDEDEKTVMSSSPFADQPEDDSEPFIAPIAAPAAAPPAASAPTPPASAPTPPTSAPTPLASAPAELAAASTAPVADPSSAFDAPPAALATPQQEPAQKKGMAPGVMMGIAGAACFGIVFAIMAAQRLLPSGASEPVAVADPTSQEGPSVAEPEIEIPPETTETPEVVEPDETEGTDEETDEETDETEGNTSTAMTTTTMTTTARNPTPSTMELSAAQAELLERFGGGTNDPDISMVTLAMDTTSNRPQLEDSAVRRVVSASANRNMLQRCYNTAIRGNPDPPNLRVDIRIRVAASGRVTSATASGGNLGQLKSCLETSVRRWVFPQSSAGGEAAFPVVFSAPG